MHEIKTASELGYLIQDDLIENILKELSSFDSWTSKEIIRNELIDLFATIVLPEWSFRGKGEKGKPISRILTSSTGKQQDDHRTK